VSRYPNPHLAQNKHCRHLLEEHSRADASQGFASGRPRRLLPLLERSSEIIDGLDLSNTFVVVSVHLLEDGDYILSRLERHGLQPEQCAILGKPYSTCMEVVLSLLSRGYFVHPASYRAEERTPLRWSSDAASADILRVAAAWCEDDDARRILILDSGGGFIRLLHRPELAWIWPRCSAVETTSQGIYGLEAFEPRIPIVNVARSWAKLTYESCRIGDAVTTETMRQVEHLGLDVRRALVTGYGAVGRNVARSLSALGLDVWVFDPDASHEDEHEHCSDRIEAIRRAELIIGCSGRVSMSRADWPHLANRTVLASGSSYDIELSGWELRSAYEPDTLPIETDLRGFDHFTFDGRKVFLGARCDPCHYTYPIRLPEERTVFLLNGGCPVNFTGGPFALPAEASAFTMALRFCGIAQAARESRIGLVSLRHDWQQRLVAHLNSASSPDAASA
jgi:S-adenosylhomocysteine hydrolase